MRRDILNYGLMRFFEVLGITRTNLRRIANALRSLFLSVLRVGSFFILGPSFRSKQQYEDEDLDDLDFVYSIIGVGSYGLGTFISRLLVDQLSSPNWSGFTTIVVAFLLVVPVSFVLRLLLFIAWHAALAVRQGWKSFFNFIPETGRKGKTKEQNGMIPLEGEEVAEEDPTALEETAFQLRGNRFS